MTSARAPPGPGKLGAGEYVVHYQRSTYLIRSTDETREFTWPNVRGHLETAGGVVEIQYEGRSLPFSIYDQQPRTRVGGY